MTTGRINQVCALPTVAMPGAARKIRSYTIEQAVLPKVTLGQQRQQAIIKTLVNQGVYTLHARCFTRGIPKQNVSKAQPVQAIAISVSNTLNINQKSAPKCTPLHQNAAYFKTVGRELRVSQRHPKPNHHTTALAKAVQAVY